MTKGSRPGGRTLLALQAAIAATGAVARLALPLSVLGLARGAAAGAVVAALVASAASAARGWLSAQAMRRAVVAAWSSAASAACARSVGELPRRREDQESASLILQGAQDEAAFVAAVVPHGAGLALAAAGIAVASVVILGAVSLLVGAALVGFVAASTAVLGRGLRRAQSEAWKGHGRLSREMRLLLEGALELRATGREHDVAGAVVSEARTVAEHQARASAVGARLGLLPASLALLVVSAPVFDGLPIVDRVLAGDRLFEASILAVAALTTGFAGTRIWEQWASSVPRRARFRAFLRGAAPLARATGGTALAGSLSEVPIVYSAFGRDWNGDGVLTPRALDLVLPPRGGVVFVGPNGSGKTTAALALLGVVAPTAGTVRIAGADAHTLDRGALGSRIGYVPQDPFLYPGESLAWHLALHEAEPPGDAAIDRALAAVGLAEALGSRARARGVPVRDLPTGELSGGERRRLALARALLRPRELYVLDEPEAALDASARVMLRKLLEDLARRARVVVVAHDASAIPPAFERVEFS